MRYVRSVMILIALLAAARTVLAVEEEVSNPSAAEDDADLMQPTQYSIRLTPAIARGFGRMMVRQELIPDATVTEEQESKLADAAARRLIKLGHERGSEFQEFAEYYCKAMMETNARFDAKSGEEFGQRTGPMIELYRDLVMDVAQDAREILSPEQVSAMDRRLKEVEEELGNMRSRMHRWADGEATSGERPFYDSRVSRDDSDGKRRTPRAIRRAERSADWLLKQIGPGAWSNFLLSAKHLFKFDAEQEAKGDSLLATCRRRAAEIMTDDWRQSIRENRIKYSLRWSLRKTPTAPWVYHIERRFKEMTEPVRELGRSFRDDVIALATDEQREAALTEVQTLAMEHGMTTEELDALTFVMSEIRPQ